jgi:glutamate racemase
MIIEKECVLGVFDSGVGGLSVVREIQRLLPHLSIIYIGDNKRAPYGNRSEQEIVSYTKEMLGFLKSKECDYYINACNSISVTVGKKIIQDEGVPFDRYIDIATATADYFPKDASTPIVCVATERTIQSGAYRKVLERRTPLFLEYALPKLAYYIEQSDIEGIRKDIISWIIAHNLPTQARLFLGCTHYPLVRNIFEEELHKRGFIYEITDPAAYVAQVLKPIMYMKKGRGSMSIFTTKMTQTMQEYAKEFKPQIFEEIILG